MKKEITFLPTWDWSIIYELDWSIEDYVEMKKKIKEEWWDSFRSDKYRTEIKFNSIQNPRGKTQYIALEAPKEEYKEKTVAEREKIAETIRKAYKTTEEGRKKRFIERKQEILLELEKKELEFWLDSTLEKLKDYNKLKLENDKSKIIK